MVVVDAGDRRAQSDLVVYVKLPSVIAEVGTWSPPSSLIVGVRVFRILN